MKRVATALSTLALIIPSRKATFALLILTLVGTCARDPYSDTLDFYLDEDLLNGGASRAQAYYYPEDPVAWRRKVAAADSIWSDRENSLSVLHDGVYYVLQRTENPDTPLIATEPLPGFERAIAKLDSTVNVFHDENYHRLRANIYSTKITLDGERIRIGVVQTLDRAFPWMTFPFVPRDYLFLMLPDQGVVVLNASQKSVGAITDQTVFRVGRRYYALTSLSDNRRHITVEPLREGRGLSLVAELDLNYRRIPVRTITESPRDALLARTPGKQLAIYMTRILDPGQEAILRLDSAYAALPTAERERLDLAIVSNFSYEDEVRKTVKAMGLQLPVYVSTPKTCADLNCYPQLPRYVLVDERGRFKSYFGRSSKLLERLREGKGDLIRFTPDEAPR